MPLEKLMALDDRPATEIVPNPPTNPRLRRFTSAAKLQALLPLANPQPSPEETTQTESAPATPTLTVTPNTQEQTAPAPWRRTRTVQAKPGTGPEKITASIHLTGDYLVRNGFGVGRSVDVLVEQNKITIVPTNPYAPVQDRARVNRIKEMRYQMRAIMNKMMAFDPVAAEQEMQLLVRQNEKPPKKYDCPANRKEERKKKK